LAAVALAAAGLVIYRWRTSGFAWREFGHSLANMDPLWLAAALGLMFLAYAIRSMRWLVMIRPLNSQARLWDILVATCIGFTGVVFFGRAGELVRPYLIAMKAQVPFAGQIAAWLVERILDLLMVVVVFGVALTQVSHRSSIQFNSEIDTTLHAAGYTGALIGVAMLALLISLERFRGNVHVRVLGALSFLPDRARYKAGLYLAGFEKGMESMRSTGSLLALVGFSILDWVVIAASFVCMGRAFPATSGLSPTDMVILLGFVTLGSILQVPGIGGGLQIVAALVLTEFYGLTLESASGFALLLWVVSFVSIVPFGVLLAFHEGIKWRNLKNIKVAAHQTAP
jgi:uncharacterized protein (TIRG00374 family)